jgi:RHS repeat-associated protein
VINYNPTVNGGQYNPDNPEYNITTRYAYDAVGNQEIVTDTLGRMTTFEYDALNRVVTTTANYDPGGPITSDTNVQMFVTYDPTGNRTATTDARGQMTTYEYDPLNRVITTTNALDGQTSVAYDGLGNRLSTTDANGHTTTFTYDDLGRLTQTTNATGLTTTITYDGLGNRLSVINGANETTEFEYDDLNRLTVTRDPLQNETTYGYDAGGNRLSLTDAENVETRYGYDDLGRLTHVTEDAGGQAIITHYGYDAVGNRTVVTDANLHATTYVYDPLGRRVEQRDPLDHTTTFTLDILGLPEVISTTAGSRYLHLPGVIMTQRAGEVKYLLPDGLGSVRQVVGESAEVVAYYEYDPYGSPVGDEGGEPFGFTGEWWEGEVGLLHLRARWYAPGAGVFVSRDAVFSSPQYRYASNNPINRVDPSGLIDFSTCSPSSSFYPEEAVVCRLDPESIWHINRQVLAVNFGWGQRALTYNSQDRDLNTLLAQMETDMWNINPHLRRDWDHPYAVSNYVYLPADWVPYGQLPPSTTQPPSTTPSLVHPYLQNANEIMLDSYGDLALEATLKGSTVVILLVSHLD